MKKINWNDWHNERALILYDADDIKFYWKKFRSADKDCYEPPFPFTSLRIAIREFST